LRLFVHSWHLGSRTSDEGFHNINSTLIIFFLGHGPVLAGSCGRSSRSYQAGGFLFPKNRVPPGYLARKFNS
jgi:hypothetical protein